MKDDALLELASTKPRNLQELGRSRLLLREARKGEVAEEILKAIVVGLELPQDQLPKAPDHSREKLQVNPALADLLRVLLKARCEQEKVAQKLIASAADLDALAAGKRDVAALTAGVPRSSETMRCACAKASWHWPPRASASKFSKSDNDLAAGSAACIRSNNSNRTNALKLNVRHEVSHINFTLLRAPGLGSIIGFGNPEHIGQNAVLRPLEVFSHQFGIPVSKARRQAFRANDCTTRRTQNLKLDHLGHKPACVLIFKKTAFRDKCDFFDAVRTEPTKRVKAGTSAAGRQRHQRRGQQAGAANRRKIMSAPLSMPKGLAHVRAFEKTAIRAKAGPLAAQRLGHGKTTKGSPMLAPHLKRLLRISPSWMIGKIAMRR